jgi:signal-transduction protein with cAMP-binding, CBS, and nucleotidyltransferase domain
MPKKSASARATAQRAKQKTQKNFELVRPIKDEPSSPEEDIQQPTSTPTIASITKPLAPSGTSSPVAVESPVATSSAPASAATRLAARRQSQQRQQQRATSSLITAEHYSYVRKDLLYIAILAVVMLAAIIVLYFMIGINA